MKRIMFVGPSGIGKTTLAKFIETKYGIPFISGSHVRFNARYKRDAPC